MSRSHCIEGPAAMKTTFSRKDGIVTDERRMTNETRHEAYASSSAISGGVTAFPMRANECVMPCAKPQLPAGVQLDMARLR